MLGNCRYCKERKFTDTHAVEKVSVEGVREQGYRTLCQECHLVDLCLDSMEEAITRDWQFYHKPKGIEHER